jgi:hypothetical protein
MAGIEYRFNPPPGWSVSAGWVPPPEWTPDPSWPSAPEDWGFWLLTDPETGVGAVSPAPSGSVLDRFGRLLVVTIGAIAMLLVLCAISGVSGFLVGLGLVAGCVGIAGMLRGRVAWAWLSGRKRSAIVTARGFAAIVAGGLALPPASTPSVTVLATSTLAATTSSAVATS